jgi:hypothetical protein
MTTGKNIVRSISLAAISIMSMIGEPSTASAQGWDCGGPGWIRYPVLYTTAALEGVGEGACNIVCGVGKTCREVGYMGVDIVGGSVEICGGPRWQNWSQAGQYFDRGGSYGTYYRDFGCNLGTAGVYGQVQTSIAYYNGEIDTTTYSEQMGASGVFQLCQARVMYVQGGPGCIWRQPMRNVPAHAWARCTGGRTPFDIANRAAPGDMYISPACRARMAQDPLWQAACEHAEAFPRQGGSPRCHAACEGNGQPIACSSGQQPGGQFGGPLAGEPWQPLDFTFASHRPGGLTCAEPRAIICSLRNGQGPAISTTRGAIINHRGHLYYRPPCNVCQGMGLNQGIYPGGTINWINRPALWLPGDVGMGVCPPQVFNGGFDPGNRPGPGRPGFNDLFGIGPGRPIRPGGGLGLPGRPGRPGLGGGGNGIFLVGPDGELVFVPDDDLRLPGACPRNGNVQAGGGVDPPYEGDLDDEGGCSVGGNDVIPFGIIPLVGGMLYLLVPWRRRRRVH